MEKIATKEGQKNLDLGNDNFKVFSEGVEYTLKLLKNENYDELNLIIRREDSMEIFEKNLNFEELTTTQCFKMSEDIDEVQSELMLYILEDKITLSPNNEGLSVTFETQFNLKKLKSVFQLNIKEENIENSVKFLKIKMNYLMTENKNKDKMIEEIALQNTENLKKIDFITNQVDKMKEMQEKQAKLISDLKNNKPNTSVKVLPKKEVPKKIASFNKSDSLTSTLGAGNILINFLSHDKFPNFSFL